MNSSENQWTLVVCLFVVCILALECKTIITEWLEHQSSTMDFLETKEEEEDSQGVDKTAMVLDEETDILDEQVEWRS